MRASVRMFTVLAAGVFAAMLSTTSAAVAASFIATGASHSCAINNSGFVQCWGDNRDGQLGTGSVGGIAATPVAVTGLPTGIVSITAGRAHTCALINAGGVFCWGAGGSGQLGNGGTAQSAAPAAVSGLGVAGMIAAGAQHTCAVLTGGAIKCWGQNVDGQIGNGSTGSGVLVPTDVSGLSMGVASVSAGGQHTCVTLQTGGAKCWGSNAFGQLGDNGSTTTPRTSPANVSTLSSGVSSVAAGSATTCARLVSGGLKCWGRNDNYTVGDGTAINRLVPVDVAGLTSGVSSVSVGNLHACALLTSGELRCWGSNRWGQSGTGNTGANVAPVGVALLGRDVVQIAVGEYHSCARLTSGGVICWGRNWLGQTGDAAGGNADVPVDVSGMQSGVSDVAADRGGTCALTNGGAVKCWGNNSYGEVGDGTVGSIKTTPVQVSGLTSGIQKVARGGYSACAVTVAGDVKCWGNNSWGQLGDGTYTSRFSPVALAGLSGSVVDIGVSRHFAAPFACAVTFSGGVHCWGNNLYGQLGNTGVNESWTPLNVLGISGATAISVGESHACALAAGGIKCWGRNNFGQLGNNSVAAMSAVPVDVVGASTGVTSLSAGNAFTCAIISGVAKCWGENGSGQLGDATKVARLQPTTVVGLGSGATVITAGGYHACALTAVGATKCWGYGDVGQTGDGTFRGSNTPKDVSLPLNSVAKIWAGHEHTCAVTTVGALKCWGNNDVGQLGVGTTSQRMQPESSVVGFAASVTTISVSPTAPYFGQTVTIAAVLTGQSPTGTITFKDSAAVLPGCAALAMVSGRASCSTAGLTIGMHSISAAYVGDANNPASTSSATSLAVTPTPGAVTLSTSANPVLTGQPVSFIATVGGTAPSGTVSFYDGAQVIAGCGTVALSGGNPATALCGPLSTLSIGLHIITAAYLGDSDNAANQALLAQSVTQSAAGSVPTVAVGGNHACSVDTSGLLRCWGGNFNGELGDGTLVKRALPAPVAGLSTGIRSVAAGSAFTCAVTANGGVKCWGYNYAGQVGDGTTIDRTTPTDVLGLASGVSGVTVGSAHACALLTGGGVNCWGDNGSGQLGNGNSTNQSSPAQVAGLAGLATAIAAGGSQTCALLGNGALQCWGAGRLGDGTTSSRSAPTNVIGLSASVARVVVGGSQICALLVDASMQCWGSNSSGQLGDGTTTTRLTPSTVLGITGATTISAGNSVSCAVVAAGALKCWGSSSSGRVGNGTEQAVNPTPQAVIGLSSGVASVATGGIFSCAMTVGGSIRCWGGNNNGELGLGSFGFQSVPKDVSLITGGTAALAAGGFHACALDTAGGLKCWGSRFDGAVGDGQILPSPQRTPVAVTGIGSPVAQVSAGFTHNCVVTTAGSAKCWGSNSSGALGDNTQTRRATAGDVSTLTVGVAAISAGWNFSCAVTTAGAATCWGNNSSGQLGNASTQLSLVPQAVSGLSGNVAKISAGGSSACGVLITGGVKCWGLNASGQLGDGTTVSRGTPVDVVGLSSGVAMVSVGSGNACALMTTGSVKCWGDNTLGTLGQGGTISSSLTPVDTLSLGAAAVNVGVNNGNVCALLVTGEVKCWGYNAYGQMGDSTTTNRASPVTPVGLGSNVVALSVGVQFACALLNSGSIKCWGDNQAGAMGNGTVGYETTATRYTAGLSLTRPLSVADAATVTARVDGAMIARYLAGLSGNAIAQGIDTTGALRTDATELARYFDVIRPLLDIDGNTQFSPLTDGLLLIRYMLGMRGSALVAGAVGSGAARSTAQIEAYLATLLP